MQVGDKVIFGDYKWIVLDIQGEQALIITEYIIDQRSYHNTYCETTWADCAMRHYLNHEFYDGFHDYDKKRICPVTNKNPDNLFTYMIGKIGEGYEERKK